MDAGSQTAPTLAQVTATTLAEGRGQLDRVLASSVFRDAHALQKFLEYIGAKTLVGLSEEIKEYSIGTEVFGRSVDYDPRIDNVVRVQALRLREKLREYYDGEGVADEVLVEIPKGHYVPRFTRRTAHAAEFGEVHSSPHTADLRLVLPTRSQTDAEQPAVTRRWVGKSLQYGIGAALFLAIGFFIAHAPINGLRPAVQPVRQIGIAAEQPPAGAELWSGFINTEPIVAYSNDLFLKTESSDLLRVRSQEVLNLGATPSTELAKSLSINRPLLMRAGPVSFDDTYTGTGEVMGIYFLTRLFLQLHTDIGVKRSRLITTDDLRRHDMIFLGSTRENALLAGLPLTQDFVFDWPQSGGLWKGRIINLRPRQGEAGYYAIERESPSNLLRTDYAIISFLPGMTPSGRIVVLAGLTTLGTQAAAQFATSEAGMTKLMELKEEAPPPSKKTPRFFQALLKVQVMRGEILNTTYVTGHTLPISQNRPEKN